MGFSSAVTNAPDHDSILPRVLTFTGGMRDGSIRRTIKQIARYGFMVSLAFSRSYKRWRSPPPFTLGGECQRCAKCCEAPGIQVNKMLWSFVLAADLFLWWQKKVNGFVLDRRDDESTTFIFKCTHFDETTRLCDSYESRPAICRDYPRVLLDSPSPDLFPECGYRPIARNAGSLLTVLNEQDLTPEQREKLKKGLHLE